MSNRLLVIDDSNIHRMILCRVGEKVGFETVGAASFDEAAKLLRESKFDCITLDLSLGERAGVEVLHLLSVLKYEAPIIIISGSENAVCEETVRIGKSLDLNICASLQKPIDLKALRELLEDIRKQSRLERPADSPF